MPEATSQPENSPRLTPTTHRAVKRASGQGLPVPGDPASSAAPRNPGRPAPRRPGRKRLGRLGGRPPAFDREACKRQNTVDLAATFIRSAN